MGNRDMAGFIVFDTSKDTYNKKLALIDCLSQKGFNKTYSVNYSNYEIIYVKKVLIEDINIIEHGNNFILSQGTFIYKKKYGREAITAFYNDYIDSSVENSEIFGHFNLVFSHKGRIIIKSDAYSSLPIYYDKDLSILSSFFLGICDVSDTLTPNADVIASNIITGCVYDPVNTYFQEVKKLYGNCSFPNIYHQINPLPLIKSKKKLKSFSEEIKDQKTKINYFIQQTTSLLSNGVDIGLSAGFDSRLILAIISEHLPDSMRLHTHWKKKPDSEVVISRKLANSVNHPLNEEPVENFRNCSKSKKTSIALKSFYFYDGQIRVNHSLFSQYRNPGYRKALLGKSKVGLTGLGGEQYRNDLSFVYHAYPLDWYIREYIFDSISGITFYNKNYQTHLIQLVKEQITDILSLNYSSHISKDNIRIFFNRLWVKSGPGYRNVAENQLSYFLSPFNDPYLSESALKIRNLGFSIKFQSALISSFSPRLANINSNYKIAFNRSNYKYRLNRFILGLMIPSKTKRAGILNTIRRRHNIDTPIMVKDVKDDFYLQYIYYFRKSCPQLNIDKVKFESNAFNRICGIGLLLKEYENKVNLNY